MKFIADKDEKRLDTYICTLLTDVSRSKIQSAVKNGEIKLNGVCAKSSSPVREGDVIEVDFQLNETVKILPQNIDIEIVYEDENMAVVNKPSGMLTHPTTIEKEGTLVNALLYRFGENLSDINGEFRRGILHRLDRNTSGLLMIAKNNQAHEFLANQIKEKSAIRQYLAVVKGIIQEPEGVINLPIGRNPKQPEKMAVVENGKPSITRYKVLEKFDNATFVELTLLTGRTHQIRVHMSHSNHPVFNDTLYGFGEMKVKTQEQVLQAYRLRFTKPFKDEIIQLEIPQDDKLKKVLKYLRSKNT